MFAFNNGIYDSKMNEFLNININIKEELTECATGYDYSQADPLITKEINDALESIITNEDNRNFFMKAIASCIDIRGNTFNLNKIYILYNMNELLENLITSTFGEYYQKIEIALLGKRKVKKRFSDHSMARIKDCKLIISNISEDDEDVVLKSAKLKELCGREQILSKEYGRNKKPFIYIPKFTLFLKANHGIKIDEFNESMSKRMVVIKFQNDYDNNALRDKIKNDSKYKVAFFHILCNYYKNMKDNYDKLEIPEGIIKDSEEYFGINNNNLNK